MTRTTAARRFLFACISGSTIKIKYSNITGAEMESTKNNKTLIQITVYFFIIITVLITLFAIIDWL